MKILDFKVIYLCILICLSEFVMAQSETVISPSNRSSTSMEKNMLFYADKRFSVSQSGSAALNLSELFNGNFQPQYTGGIDSNNPYVILIKDLPHVHSQVGAWVGWTTRYYSAKRFKIEAYNVYVQPNAWVTVADVQNYNGGSYIVQLPQLATGQLRFTFYEGEGPAGALGLSELFYINNEGAVAYDGLLVKYNHEGNVGIGADAIDEKLAVNGNIRAKEVKVETTNWPDYVFDDDYKNLGLSELEQYIKMNKHLPDVPSAGKIEQDGLALGEMNKILLKKIEELTLHLIEKDKAILSLRADKKNTEVQMEDFRKRLAQLESVLKKN